MKRFLALGLFLSSAAAMKVQLSLPQGLQPGQSNAVELKVDGQNTLPKGFSLVVEGGQNGQKAVQQINFDGPTSQISLPKAGLYRLGLRLSQDGKNYGQAVEIRVPSPAGEFNFEFDEPNTRASVPLLQIFLWVVLAAVLGFVAFRQPRGQSELSTSGQGH